MLYYFLGAKVAQCTDHVCILYWREDRECIPYCSTTPRNILVLYTKISIHTQCTCDKHLLCTIFNESETLPEAVAVSLQDTHGALHVCQKSLAVSIDSRHELLNL